MSGMRKIILIVFCLLTFFFSVAQDSASVNADDYSEDCFTNFFARAAQPVLTKTLLITKAGKTLSLSSFLKTETQAEVQHGLIDLNNDGKKELIIYNYSGGAHCCDEFYFFKNIGTNKYQYAAKTFGGNVCVTDSNEFLFDFAEQFGYFYTCYACAFEPNAEVAANPVHNIVLKYNNGKLAVVPGDNEKKNAINDYLAYLSEQPFEKLKTDIDQDNGLRKEFAFHFAVFYYSFGRNMIETKKLFDKYYKYPDAKTVWT